MKRVVCDRDTLTPLEVMAVVRSSRDNGGNHIVDLRQGRWMCTCPVARRDEPCAHLTAVILVTLGAAA